MLVVFHVVWIYSGFGFGVEMFWMEHGSAQNVAPEAQCGNSALLKWLKVLRLATAHQACMASVLMLWSLVDEILSYRETPTGRYLTSKYISLI